MRYEFNGHLVENDRIDLVSYEIVDKYPKIPLEKAKEIAMLEGGISNNADLEIKFNRLYNIMLVMKAEINVIKEVYCDLIILLKNNIDNSNSTFYYSIVSELTNFLNNERDFPYLNEFLS